MPERKFGEVPFCHREPYQIYRPPLSHRLNPQAAKTIMANISPALIKNLISYLVNSSILHHPSYPWISALVFCIRSIS
jgi:hypothetical protein